jgi:hypothetical protein
MLQSDDYWGLQWRPAGSDVDTKCWVSAKIRDHRSHKSWRSVTACHFSVLLIETDVVGIAAVLVVGVQL